MMRGNVARTGPDLGESCATWARSATGGSGGRPGFWLGYRRRGKGLALGHKAAPPDSLEGKAFQYFADKIAEYSGGKIDLKICPSEQLGKTEAALEQAQAGTVDIYPEGASYLKK